MDAPLVTVTSYHSRNDAGVAKGALDEAGIESVVEASERVKLRVQNLDAIRAGDVLEAKCATLDEIGEADEEAIEPEACARCGSPDVFRPARGVTFGAIAMFAIGIGVAVGLTDAAFLAIFVSGVFLLISGRWRCAECGESWN